MLKKILEVLRLPRVKILFVDNDNTGELKDLYHHFTKRHSKYFIFKNKTIGVMLYKLPKSLEEYENKIGGKNSVSYYSRRCKKMGYYTKYFNQKDFLDDIYNINTSITERQGHKMSDAYLNKPKIESKKKFVDYIGVFNKDDILVGYIRLIKTKNLFVIGKLLGHNDYLKDNIMYLLLNELTKDLIEKNKNNDLEQYFMYDTYFGGTNGLRLFKKRNCFEPYRVKWKYEKEI